MIDVGVKIPFIRKKIENNRQVLMRLIAELSFTMEKGRKDYLSQRINKFIKLLSNLSRQGV